jgi:endonuclease/exonuclease/phosphatase family metal-dependent hydrolase
MIKKILFTAMFLLFIFPSCQENPFIEEEKVSLRIEECLIPTYSSSFDILTWNVREFPVYGDKTVSLLAEMILKQNPDLIALQEIKNEEDFECLVDKMPGWEGIVIQSSDLNPAFLYKTNEINLIGTSLALFTEEKQAFPRPPLLISAHHHTGLQIFFINVHLKCCSGRENEIRRRRASNLLKTYIDEKLAGEKVIVLGDFNDTIYPADSAENVFINFSRDSLNYLFIDLDIARGDPAGWSYPTWPSHIDHFLISNELFDMDLLTQTLPFDQCDASYFTYISDHRPMLLRIQ